MKDQLGIVYVLTNPYMPGIVKIGMTVRGDIDVRLRELYTTGVPVQFECAYACKVKTTDCARIEKALHKAFAPDRRGHQGQVHLIRFQYSHRPKS